MFSEGFEEISKRLNNEEKTQDPYTADPKGEGAASSAIRGAQLSTPGGDLRRVIATVTEHLPATSEATDCLGSGLQRFQSPGVVGAGHLQQQVCEVTAAHSED